MTPDRAEDHALATVRRFRAPAADGAILVEPLPAAPHPAASLPAEPCDIAGVAASVLRRQARSEVLALAAEYTRETIGPSAGETCWPDISADKPLICTGHQPQLFHPGVWFKNFLTAARAQRLAGVGLNLLADGDVYRTTALRVPAGPADSPRAEHVAFDRSSPARPPVPFEESRVHDRAHFATFAARAGEVGSGWLTSPLLAELWPEVVAAELRTGNVGRAFAAARQRLEWRHGVTNLELPLSRACDTASFRRFVVHLLAHAATFRDIHNAALAEYRRLYRLRNAAQPVPDLATDADAIETPFWVWTADAPQRQRLFVRGGERLRLQTAGATWSCELSRDPDRAIDELARAAAAGVRLRPRALTTTLFARLFVADEFVHGIGGGMYDQVTDALIERFFGGRPPPLIVATATRLLPISRPAVSRDDLRRVGQRLRKLRFQPERFAPANATVAALAAEKRAWLAQQPPYGQGRPRFAALLRINEALHPFVADQRAAAERERDEFVRLLRDRAVLASREYAFALFPESLIGELKSGAELRAKR